MVLNIADIILRIAKQEGNQITPMQLMKLTYIANGWHLGLHGKKLFENRIEAWKYGPVMPDLYQSTKQYGKNPIPNDLIPDGFDGLPENLNNKVEFLTQVYSLYENKDGIELSSLTHMAGSPWDKAYIAGVNCEIDSNSIKDHYESRLVTADVEQETAA